MSTGASLRHLLKLLQCAIKAVSTGVELRAVQEGIPAIMPIDQCCAGSQQSLVLLGQLAEAEINQ